MGGGAERGGGILTSSRGFPTFPITADDKERVAPWNAWNGELPSLPGDYSGFGAIGPRDLPAPAQRGPSEEIQGTDEPEDYERVLLLLLFESSHSHAIKTNKSDKALHRRPRATVVGRTTRAAIRASLP